MCIGSAFVNSLTLTPKKKPQSFCSTRRPTCCQTNTNGTDGSGKDEEPPVISKDWREFRATLVAGSVEKHENKKAAAHRTGHWAHPVSTQYLRNFKIESSIEFGRR